MITGIPKEIKRGERRVAIDPYWTNQFVGRGHEVLIEKDAGLFSGFEDKAYKQAGGQILDRSTTLWSRADLIAKFKEIQKEEYPLMHEGQIITCFFHLAEDVNPEMCDALKSSKVTTFSLEQLLTRGGLRVAVAPMSEMAGWIAAIQMVKLLFEPPDSIGVALANFSGAGAPRITVLGGGVVRYFAAKTLAGIGAEVSILEVDRAIKENPAICGALNYHKGRLVNQEVAIRQNLEVERKTRPP